MKETGKGTNHSLDNPLHLVPRLHSLQEGDVGACGHSGTEPGDGFVKAETVKSICSCDNDDIGTKTGTSCNSSPNARHKGVNVNKLLAKEMAASFDNSLIFNVEARNATKDVSLDLV